MIAACPKCAARYRVERERLQTGSVRLRCARCEAVFRVRPPDAAAPAAAPAPQPALEAKRNAAPPAATAEAKPAPAEPRPAPAQAAGELVLVAMPAGEVAQRTAQLLSQRGLRVRTAGDGVEAMLEIQRTLPRAVVLAADLAKMYGFQICEVLKRNESLRGIWVVLVGAIHHPERYRREPGELYGADAYVEGPELPAGLLPVLARGGIAVGEGAAPPAAKAPPAGSPIGTPLPEPRAKASPVEPSANAPLPEPPAAPLRAPAPPAAPLRAHAPPAAPLRAPAPPASRSQSAAAPPRSAAAPAQTARAAAPVAPPRRSDGLDDERAKAERLARIVVSDIVLYNERRFAAAARSGNVIEAMAADLAEGRQLFEERIDPRVRAERDHLTEELVRRAQAQGMR